MTLLRLVRRPAAAVRRDDRGISTAEYVGVVVVAVVLVGAVVAGAARVGPALTSAIGAAFCGIDGIACAAEAPPAPAGGTQDGTGADGSDADRRDTARDARDSRRDDRGRTEPSPGPEPTTGGSQGSPGLGDPVPGESVPVPEPPPWQAVDAGAGEYDSEGAGPGNHATKFAAEAGANALSGTWPNASRNLLHFLGNSGEPLLQDVDRLLADVPALGQEYTDLQDEMGVTAVLRAQEDGVDGPVTYPLTSPWTGFYVTKDLSQDWFYAMGGIQWSVVGEVTVYPPTETEPRWTYETTTSMLLRDQYNWDGGKSTDIGPFTVTDEQLAELHRAGLAQEFTATGQSAVSSRRGAR